MKVLVKDFMSECIGKGVGGGSVQLLGEDGRRRLRDCDACSTQNHWACQRLQVNNLACHPRDITLEQIAITDRFVTFPGSVFTFGSPYGHYGPIWTHIDPYIILYCF